MTKKPRNQPARPVHQFSNLRINEARLLERITDFATIGATEAGGVNRGALGGHDRVARKHLTELARARGFEVMQDAAANLFIRREGTNPDLPPLLIGSHLDSQPTGGRYDGALGTLSAFEVLETLEDMAIATGHPVEVVAWTNEEGSRFQPGCMGSMAFVGVSHPSDWSEHLSADGKRLGDELNSTLEALADVPQIPLGHPVAAYLEVHIEQGPVLEREQIPIGIVTGVQGTRWLEITFLGEAAHAGTTPLEFRRDPMAAAVQAIAVLQSTIMPQDEMARLTVGRFQSEPGAINVIPNCVRFTVDIRHPDPQRLDLLEAAIRTACEAAAMQNRCGCRIESKLDMAPVCFAPELTEVISTVCEQIGLASREIISGAFHDAVFLQRQTPSAMIFVPCRDGISHNEAEFVEDRHVANGANVLLLSLLERDISS